MIKVLIVDNKPHYPLRDYLNDGFEVTFEENSLSAIETYLKIRPDIVLLDINMPEMDGYEVARGLSKQSYQCSVVFSSMKTAIDDEIKGFCDYQVNAYFCKPLKPALIATQLKSLVKLKQMSSLAKARKIALVILGHEDERNNFSDLVDVEIMYCSANETDTILQNHTPAVLFVSALCDEEFVYKHIQTYRQSYCCSVLSVQPNRSVNTKKGYVERLKYSLELGADDYVEIPVDKRLLAARLFNSHAYKDL